MQQNMQKLIFASRKEIFFYADDNDEYLSVFFENFQTTTKYYE